VYELIDRIVTLDIGRRGIDRLYQPARDRAGGPLCKAAAEMLADLRRGDHLMILTGSPARSWVSKSIGESDGPIGASGLARAISEGFDAVTVLITDRQLMAPTAALVRRAGPSVVDAVEAGRVNDNPRFTSVAVVDSCSEDDEEARREAAALIDSYAPRAVIAVERLGLTREGTYCNAVGHPFAEGRSRLDHVVHEASSRGIPTIGIGDGGNEIGMGAIADAVRTYMPHGAAICSVTATDIVLPVGVSNWGCYGIQAALALLTGRPVFVHPPALERRLIEATVDVGFIDSPLGKGALSVDGLGIDIHVGITELLAAAVSEELGGRSALAPRA
jgi:hypothetical protein